jgi:hypothetical protein
MMKQTSICALGLALSLVAGAGWAQGQGGGQGGGRPGGRPGFGGGFGGPGGGGVTGLLRIPEVQAELKVDEAQKELLDQVSQEMFQKMRTLFQPPAGGAQGNQGNRFQPPSPETMKKMAALQADQLKQVGEILDPKQMARLKQLGVQQAGTRALAQDEVAAQLKLSADQRQRITAAVTGEQEAMRSLFTGFEPGTPPTDEQRAEWRKKMTDARSATDAKLLAVLTEPQKTQFKALQGAPFKFPEFRFGGPGGPGGRRPGGGQNN